MSLWKRIVAFSPEVEQRMKQYYDEKGLADVRVYFAQWIEDRIMSERISNPNTDLYEQIAHHFYEELKQKLITLSNDNLIKFKLADICALVTQTPAVDLYSHVRNGVQKELQLLEQMPQMSCFSNTVGIGAGNGIGGGGVSGRTPFGVVPSLINGMGEEMAPLFGNLRGKVELLGQNTRGFVDTYVRVQEMINDFNQKKMQLSPQIVIQNEMQLQEQYNVLLSSMTTLQMEAENVATDYDSLQDRVINELRSWQRNQALAGNGAHFQDNLDQIQRCIEALVEMVGKILTDLNTLIHLNLGDTTRLNELLRHVREAQVLLVLSAFIVEKQPPQVMKTHTRFASAVRWLIGPQLGIYLNNPTVECMILSEAQAQRHSAQRTMAEAANGTPASSGEISNNVSTMEFQQTSGNFSASFRNMILKKIKRAEKKGTESVMDEKFALLFFTSSIVNDYRIRVWTLSLPVVVIVHGNQEPQSWATITWDNAFSEIVREPFATPEKVSWPQLAYALNTKFASATGRSLTEENLNFLYEKLFRNDGVVGDHKDITWAQFCKETLPDRSFTFWDWFFAIIKLTKDHLPGLWKAGLVVGFINKRRTTDEILTLTPIGTFLLRFSDSELGGISVAFVDDNNQVIMVAPWTSRDLTVRCLADRIQDLTFLHYVYPSGKPKDEVFGEFYSQRMEEQTTRDGYVANTIRAHVPAIEGAVSLSNTPQHHMQSPHPQDMQIANNNVYTEDIDMYLNIGNWENMTNWDSLRKNSNLN